MLITNLGFTAFLLLNKYKLTGAPTRDLDGKFIFPIDIEQEDHDRLLMEYTQSDFSKFDSFVVNLKRMLPRY